MIEAYPTSEEAAFAQALLKQIEQGIISSTQSAVDNDLFTKDVNEEHFFVYVVRVQK